MNDEQRIPISFDKRHIITLGRRMYKESIDLIRELVNNAYDADASRVDIDLTPKIIRVTDNGSGMNMEELHLYFKVGSEHKKETGRSKRFGRKLIGEMGIGFGMPVGQPGIHVRANFVPIPVSFGEFGRLLASGCERKSPGEPQRNPKDLQLFPAERTYNQT